MEKDEFELTPLHQNVKEEESEMKKTTQETDFGGEEFEDATLWDNLTDYSNSLSPEHVIAGTSLSENTGVIIRESVEAARIRNFIRRNVTYFFNKIIELEPQCTNTKFIDYVVDYNYLTIRTFRSVGLGRRTFSEYKVTFLGGEFNTTGQTLTNEEVSLLRDGIRGQYDEWTKANLNKTPKKAGVVTAIGIGVIAVVAGLSFGLTRKGSDIVHQAKGNRTSWEKLHQSKKTDRIPWIDIQTAGGKAIIFIGQYLMVIIAAGVSYFLLRRC